MSQIIPDWLTKYYDRGFRLIFYPTKLKGPIGADAVGWTTRSDTAEEWKDGSNLGTITGHEVSPGKFLVDIDFDWAEGLPLAKHILPATGFGFGRTTRTISHAFYTTDKPVISQSFLDTNNKPFVELRGTKVDGSLGNQTMLPPSIHPNGETLLLRNDNDLGHYTSEELSRRVLLYAISCLLYSHFSGKEFLHEVRLSTSGFLLTEGLTFEEALLVGTSICRVAGNNDADFKTVLQTTANKIKQGDKIQGKGHLIKSLGEDGKAVISRIKEWLGNEEFICDSKGKPIRDSQENVRIALEKINVQLTYDIFSQKPLINYGNGNDYNGPLVDQVVTSSWLEIDEKFQFRPSKDFYYDVMQNICNKNKFHPVIDYLKSLTWDGEPRVDKWLIVSGKAADTPYVRAVSSLMLIAAVRRVTNPGCKFDEMVVLESAQQGLMKSTALRTMCPDETWFSDDLPLNVDAKQIVERTLGKWIIEASDLSGMHRSRVEQLKGMLSRQVDGPVRLAYGRLPVEQRRQFIIVGTTNSYTYLSDSTGNRRFWPIRVEKFDIEWIKLNRDQIWAESYSREQQGETIRLDPTLYSYASIQQERRRAEDPWEVALDMAFPRSLKHRLSPDDVWGAVGMFQIEKRDAGSNDRILKAMNHLGFRRMTVKSGDGKIVKGFGRDVEIGQLGLERDNEEHI